MPLPCMAAELSIWGMTVSRTGLVVGAAGPSLPVNVLRGLLLLHQLLLLVVVILAPLLVVQLQQVGAAPSSGCWRCVEQDCTASLPEQVDT